MVAQRLAYGLRCPVDSVFYPFQINLAPCIALGGLECLIGLVGKSKPSGASSAALSPPKLHKSTKPNLVDINNGRGSPVGYEDCAGRLCSSGILPYLERRFGDWFSAPLWSRRKWCFACCLSSYPARSRRLLKPLALMQAQWHGRHWPSARIISCRRCHAVGN